MKNIFSYWGTYGRWEFFLYGLVIPIIVYLIFVVLSQILISPWIIFFGIIMALYITIISALKRAREAISNTTMIMIFYILIPILGLVFLLFQPASSSGKIKI